MIYDVIIIGAGPSGSTTARECARQGLSALLLDKAEFPRDKPCGGGVTVRAARLLPFDIAPVTERVIHGIRFSVRRSDEVTCYSPEPLTYLTQRRRLDAFLLEKAVAAGVTLCEGTPAASIERDQNHVVVRAGGTTYRGHTLVAADGVNGKTARLAGLNVSRRVFVGIEGNITPSGGFLPEWEHTLGLDIGSISGGYGWIFPKGDHLNIGVAGWPVPGPNLRARLEKLTRYYGYDPAGLRGLIGHRLPTRHPGSPLSKGNVLLVGDAAGLLDPLTGEGIHAAIWSGQAAARWIEARLDGRTTDLKGYDREVERELLPDLIAARQLYDLYQFVTPALCVAVLRRAPIVRDLIYRLLRGDQTYTRFLAKHPTGARIVNLSSDMMRAIPRLQRLAWPQDPPARERLELGTKARA